MNDKWSFEEERPDKLKSLHEYDESPQNRFNLYKKFCQ